MRELTLLFKITFGIRQLRSLAQARSQIQALEQEIERLRTTSEIILNINAFGWESLYVGMKVFETLKQKALGFIDVAAEMEAYRMQFETLYGSAQKAEQVLDQIKQFALMVPRWIVVHHSATDDDGYALNWKGVRDWHVRHNGWKGITHISV